MAARWMHRAPGLLALVVGGTLVLSWATVVVVDVLDAFGTRELLFAGRDSEYPYAFYRLFAEAHPVEWLQWSLLVLAGLMLALAAGRLQASGEGRRGWGVALLGLAFCVLALKDAGNPRHTIADIALGLGGPVASTLAELAVFGLVALLALAGLAASWDHLRARPAARNTLLAGYGAYALAGAMSATSDGWYVRGGRAVIEGLFADRLLPAPDTWEPGLRSWLFMDSAVEESVELMGAGLLAVGAAILLRDVALPSRDRGVDGRDAPQPPAKRR